MRKGFLASLFKPNQLPMSKDCEDNIINTKDDSSREDGSTIHPNNAEITNCTLKMARIALEITSVPWDGIGLATNCDLESIVESLTSLFFIRIVAILSHRDATSPGHQGSNFPRYTDLSTTNICAEALKRNETWPAPINSSLIEILRQFVQNIIRKYNELHYHSSEHAYHVTISYNKLLDMMLVTNTKTSDIIAANRIMGEESGIPTRKNETRKIRKTYGLKEDPLVVMAALFSAMVHDVEHRGISNRQLVEENDELAILYNDQSPAEQRSLAVAFTELRKDEFKEIRDVLFISPDEYRRFRKTVINLVLVTDIASPERTQLVKSKWKEAFGETKESKERKKKNKKRQNVSCRGGSFSGGPQRASRIPYSSINNSQNNNRKSQGRNQTDAGMDMSKGRLRQRRLPLIEDNSSSDEDNVAKGKLEIDDDSTSATPEINDDIDSSSTATESADGVESILSKSKNPFPNPTSLCVRKNGLHDRKIKSDDMLIRLSQSEEALGTSYSATTNLARASTHCGTLSSNINSLSKSMSKDLFPGDTIKAMKQTTLNRRFSSPDVTANYSLRLSIRRSLDLNGEAIENYSIARRASLSYSSSSNLGRTPGGKSDKVDIDFDDPDELKATVVLEHLIRAADTSALLQGWDQMEKWSNRLFFELKDNYDTKEFGEDPQIKWFPNQITFLESYILPLARRLDDMSVFGESIGPMFAEIVTQNRDRWLLDGQTVTTTVARDWRVSKKSSQQQGCTGR